MVYFPDTHNPVPLQTAASRIGPFCPPFSLPPPSTRRSCSLPSVGLVTMQDESVQLTDLSEPYLFGARGTVFLLAWMAEATLLSSPVVTRYEAKGVHSRRQGSGTVPLSCNLHTHSVRFNGKLYPRCVQDPWFINIRFLFWKIIEVSVKYWISIS